MNMYLNRNRIYSMYWSVLHFGTDPAHYERYYFSKMAN